MLIFLVGSEVSGTKIDEKYVNLNLLCFKFGEIDIMMLSALSEDPSRIKNF